MSDRSQNEESRIAALKAAVQNSVRAGQRIDLDYLKGSYPELASKIPELLRGTDFTTPQTDSATTADWEVHPDRMPERLGRYRVVRRIGSGGMGAVYEADDPELSRRVAVKVPYLDRHTERPEVIARFLREAKAAAAVQHPNVCPIFDAGEHDGVPYAVMALIAGGTLADGVLLDELRDPRAVAVLMQQIANGLAAIHACGITHRDLKPGNILLDDSGSNGRRIPKISDFGLARISDHINDVTRSGGLIGTPAYMAPEQAVGDTRSIGPQTDIYALGAILYQLLAGKPPFEGTPLAILAKVREELPTSLSKLRPELDARLVKVVERAMAKLPENRYASANDFATDLQQWIDFQSKLLTKSTTTVSSDKKFSRTHVAIGLMVFLLLLSGLFLFLQVNQKNFHSTGVVQGNSSPSIGTGALKTVPASVTDSQIPIDDPRVQIQWQQHDEGKVIHLELPFVIAVLANLNGNKITEDLESRRSFRERRFLTVTDYNFDDIFRQTAPRLKLSVEDPEDSIPFEVDIIFTKMDDFSPLSIVANTPSLKSMLDARAALPETEHDAFDRRLSSRLVAVLHHPEFCRLESTWRGLQYLTRKLEINQNLQIRVLNTTMYEVTRDLEKAVEVEQCELYKKIYGQMFDVLGGQQAGLLIGDYEIDVSNPDGVGFLSEISKIAMAAQCPMVFAAAPSALCLDAWDQLNDPRTLSRIVDTVQYKPYNGYRAMPEAKFTALALPHVLGRLPYGEYTTPFNEFRFQEPYDGERLGVWMNPVWATAVCVGRAMRQYGWPARICGRDGGGQISELPGTKLRSGEGDETAVGPLDVTISLSREKELSSLGFMPLLPSSIQGNIVFPNSASIAYGTSANSDSRLNVLLCAFRFSHALRAMIRDRAAEGVGPKDIDHLNAWVADYVLQEPSRTSIAEQAQRPLREGHVEKFPDPNDPSKVEVVLTLRPSYQLNGIVDPLRISIGRYLWIP